jgi:ABC-type polysaccharide/polyol phosphate export permease
MLGINNTSLISKVYFPRLIVPIAIIVAAFMDFLIMEGPSGPAATSL